MENTFIKDKISIQLPTRKRPKDVIEIIHSLINNVSDINNIEILLKIDDDDVESADIIKSEFVNHIGSLVKIIISPRLGGYLDLPTHHYSLSEISDGEWLFLFNDDLRLLTKDFDLVVKEYHNQVKFLHCGDVVGGEGWYFPLIHRSIIKTLGHLSINTPYCDGWLRVIGEKLNINTHIPIKLEHIHSKMEIDSTRIDTDKVNDVTRHGFNWDYHINDQNGLVYKDVELLRKTLFN